MEIELLHTASWDFYDTRWHKRHQIHTPLFTYVYTGRANTSVAKSHHREILSYFVQFVFSSARVYLACRPASRSCGRPINVPTDNAHLSTTIPESKLCPAAASMRLTGYRILGTLHPHSQWQAVSGGCLFCNWKYSIWLCI